MTDYALSNLEIDEFLKKDGQTVLLYDELENIDLDTFFDNAQYRIVLYTSDFQDTGHFVICLNYGIRNGKYLIEYFDSTGRGLDEANKVLCRDKALKSRTYLQDLFRDCSLIINKKRLQEDSSKVCGRHCILRALSYGTPLCHYIKILTGNKYYSADEIVAMLIKIKVKDS